MLLLSLLLLFFVNFVVGVYAQLLEGEQSGVGTGLRLERDAWSMAE